MHRNLAVSTVDYFIPPLVISGATRLSFLLVVFVVLGGLAAFALIGLFIGQVALGVATAVWVLNRFPSRLAATSATAGTT
jgi:predicted PurR-regulated permease PerM